MPQRSEKKRRLALQVSVLSLVFALGACAVQSPKPAVKPIPQFKALKYVKTIHSVGFGGNDIIKRVLAGDDQVKLRRPVAIDVNDEFMLIADRGETVAFAGTHSVPAQEQADFRETIDYERDVYNRKGISVGSAEVRIHDYNRGVIFKLDFDTGRMNVIRGAGDLIEDEISDIFIAKDKSFYVTDVEGRRALHFSAEGELLKEYKHPPNIFRPIAITVDEEKKEVLVADETYSHIVSFDMEKAEPVYGMGGRGEGPGKFRIITDMIAIPDGYLVSDRIELRVQVLDKEGNYIADFGRSELMFPTALAMDKYGRVYVSDKSDSKIKVYKAGKLIEKIGRNGYGPGEFRYISDMKIHKDQLYVVDSLNARIQVFDIVPEGNSVALNQ